jgi:hypothetical protein
MATSTWKRPPRSRNAPIPLTPAPQFRLIWTAVTASDCSTSATGTVLSCYIMPSASRSSPTHNPAFRRNLVHLIPHMLAARRLQIPHCRFHVGVTEPLLNCTQIDASPQRPPSERRSELVQPRPAAFRHSVSARACALTLIPSLDGFEENRSNEGFK